MIFGETTLRKIRLKKGASQFLMERAGGKRTRGESLMVPEGGGEGGGGETFDRS